MREAMNEGEEGLMIKNKVIRNFYLKGEPRIVGCNFSLYRETIEKINGFDENYEGPGFGEDADIERIVLMIESGSI